MQKGQSSLETIILMTVGMLVLAAFLSFAWNQIETNNIIQSQQKGIYLLDSLKENITSVYFLGVGTTREVEIEIPEFTDLEKSLIENNSLLLNIYGTDFITNLQIDVKGNWPNRIGKHKIILTSFSDYVGVYSKALSFTPSYLSQTINQGFFKDINLNVTNLLNENKIYELDIDFENDFSTVSSTLNETNISFLTNETKQIPFLFNCESNSSGTYYGQVNFISDINVSLPISLTCIASQSKLTIFPNNLTVNMADEEIEEELLVCNNSNVDLTIDNTNLEGLVRNYATYSFVGTIESNRCKILTLNFIVPLEDGEYPGLLTVFAGGLESSSNLNLVKES